MDVQHDRRGHDRRDQITLNANTSGASGALAGGGYLAGIGIKDLGGNFKITSVSLTDWGFNNDELSASGSACDSGTGSSSKRGCAFAENLGARLLRLRVTSLLSLV